MPPTSPERPPMARTDSGKPGRRGPASVLTLAVTAQVPGYFYALWEHIDDPSWSEHAQFHHIVGFLWLSGLATAVLALAWGPARRGDRWACRLLVVLTTIEFGAHLLTMALLPAGKPPVPWQNAVLAVVAAVGISASMAQLQKPN